MGGLGLGFGFATMLALSIALVGPNRLAGAVAGGLLVNWMLSNVFMLNFEMHETTIGWSYLDIASVAIFTPVWLARPSRWLGIIVAASWTQIGFHFGFIIGEQTPQDEWNSTLINNILFGIELLAVTGPTFAPQQKRKPYELAPRRRSLPRVRVERPRGPVKLRLVA